MKSTKLSTEGHINKTLSIILTILILGTIGTIIYLATSVKSGEFFTEFYMLGPDGKAEGYPTEVTVNEEVSVILGVVNRENVTKEYFIKVKIDDTDIHEIGPFTLIDEDKWEEKVYCSPFTIGNNQKIEYILYMDQQSEPYLTLHLWLDVKSE